MKSRLTVARFNENAAFVTDTFSEPFHGQCVPSKSATSHHSDENQTVVAAKDFHGMEESSILSRTFSDQGVRLRLRKEPRSIAS